MRARLIGSGTCLLLLLLLTATTSTTLTTSTTSTTTTTTTTSSSSCDDSDAELLQLQSRLCKSLGCTAACPCLNDTKADGDWPSQVTYMHDILAALVAPQTCLNTSYAQDFVAWFSVADTGSSYWWYTWLVFQVQYYDMPRLPGTRIESPATLGRKCWAFSYLKDIWDGAAYGGAEPALRPALQGVMGAAGYGDEVSSYIEAYDGAVPLTMNLCWEVMANCFVNASYDPAARNGTCPHELQEFKFGFERENVKRRSPLAYPFGY